MLRIRRSAKPRARRGGCVQPLEPRTMLASITINTSSPLQTIESMGGNYALGQFAGSVNDTIGDYTLSHLNPKMVRTYIPVSDFEPANDDSSSGSFNWANFKDSG